MIELQKEYIHYIIPNNKKKTLADSRKIQQQQQQQQKQASNNNNNNNNTTNVINIISSNLVEDYTISGDQFFSYFNRYFLSKKYIYNGFCFIQLIEYYQGKFY